MSEKGDNSSWEINCFERPSKTKLKTFTFSNILLQISWPLFVLLSWPFLFPLIYSFDSSTPLFLFFLVSLLNFVVIVIFHHILFTTLFLFLPHFVRFITTCTTFLPFPCFLFIIPLTNVPLFSTLQCLYHVYPPPYTSWCHSSFI